MISSDLHARFAAVCAESAPLLGGGKTPDRHRRLFAIAREDLGLAKLAEAHFDALAILAEAGRQPHPGALYAVWASELPGHTLSLQPSRDGFQLDGVKMFCSGSGFVDRALVTAGDPSQLVEIDLHSNTASIDADASSWQTDAFRLTCTATLTFRSAIVAADALVGPPSWYSTRPGLWNGALGPAACWAGGAAGLLDIALRSHRTDPHTLAHLAAIHADLWAMRSCLDTAGLEIDAQPNDLLTARIRALAVRHLIEQACTDTLRRFARAYGPYPLSMDAAASRRYHELDLYVRQSHAERDLELLGKDLQSGREQS